jgi:predicted nucleic acid-binding protein
MAQRRARIGDNDLIRVRRALAALPIEVEAVASDHILSAVSDLGRRLDVTSYDAAYVELAARRRLPLATLDARLRKACATLKVQVLP